MMASRSIDKIWAHKTSALDYANRIVYGIGFKKVLEKREIKATSERSDGHYVNAGLNLIDDGETAFKAGRPSLRVSESIAY